jgi:hypothetical protein
MPTLVKSQSTRLAGFLRQSLLQPEHPPWRTCRDRTEEPVRSRSQILVKCQQEGQGDEPCI